MPEHDTRVRDKQENGKREHGMMGHDTQVRDSLQHKTVSFPPF